MPYSQFQQWLDEGKIARVTVAGDTIRGELKEKLPDGAISFVTQRVPTDIAAELSRHGVTYSGAPGIGAFGQVLSWIMPPLLFVGIWIVASRMMSGGGGGGGMLGGGLLSVGRSRAKLVAETDVRTTFDDVAGVDEAKEELHEIVDFLKRPEEFTRLGAHMPRGVLLVGPARHRQDAAGARRGGRGGGAVLRHQRRRVRRDVRRRGRGPGARPVRAGAQGGALHHLHRRAGCAGAGARTPRR